MASILQSVFSKGLYSLKVRYSSDERLSHSCIVQSPDAVSRFKTVGNNVMLYVGLISYTAIGAKVRNVPEYLLNYN